MNIHSLKKLYSISFFMQFVSKIGKSPRIPPCEIIVKSVLLLPCSCRIKLARPLNPLVKLSPDVSSFSSVIPVKLLIMGGSLSPIFI